MVMSRTQEPLEEGEALGGFGVGGCWDPEVCCMGSSELKTIFRIMVNMCWIWYIIYLFNSFISSEGSSNFPIVQVNSLSLSGSKKLESG